MPITYNELIPLAKKYVTEEETAIKVMAPETATLAAAVSSGNLAAARRDWLTAHLQYETLGDAYGAFGNFDDEIDGRADAVGVHSPQWTGFYRLEYGLWHGQSLRSLVPVANTLNKNVDQLAVWWPTQEVTLADLGRRAHEVIENALEFQLTGHDDYGSGTTLASTAAAINASRVLLALLHPLLATRYPGLPSVYSGLDQLQSLLDKERLPNGWWVPESGAVRSPPGRRSTPPAGRCCRNSPPSRPSPSRGTASMPSESPETPESQGCGASRRTHRRPRPRCRPGGRSCAAWPAGSRAA